MKNIISALLEVQKRVENAHKDAQNPHFRNNYATLESVLSSVKSIANDNGIVIVQSAGKDAEGHYVDTILLHTSGEKIESKVYLVLDKNNMQGLGSAITYARRYSLAGVFAIGQEDDDGNKASVGSSNHQPAPVASRPIVKIPKQSTPHVSYESFIAKPAATQSAVAAVIAPVAVSSPLKNPRVDEIVAAAKAHQWSNDEVKSYMANIYKKDKAADLTPEETERLIKNITLYSYLELTEPSKD